MSKVSVIVPFRDRTGDPCRRRNLDRVLPLWWGFDAAVLVVDDGRTGAAQFCRSAAYNRGIVQSDADVFVFAEADMLVDHGQVRAAVRMASESLGLVVPFTVQKLLSSADSAQVRGLRKRPDECAPMPHPYGEDNNYGCLNVVSRATIEAVGRWDESFDGNGHDDCAMWRAFEVAAGMTRFVEGPAYHLWHVEGIRSGASAAEKAATERNFRRMQLYTAARTPEEIRHLTGGGVGLSRDWRGRLR